jgi:hypothetical protein
MRVLDFSRYPGMTATAILGCNQRGDQLVVVFVGIHIAVGSGVTLDAPDADFRVPRVPPLVEDPRILLAVAGHTFGVSAIEWFRGKRVHSG